MTFKDPLQIFHYNILSFTTVLYPKFLPGTLTFSEIFTFQNLNALYTTFAVESLFKQDLLKFIAGNNNYNFLVFSPVR